MHTETKVYDMKATKLRWKFLRNKWRNAHQRLKRNGWGSGSHRHASVNPHSSSPLGQYRIAATNVEWLPLPRRSSQGEIDQTNAIRNEISRHIELFSPLLLGGKRKDTVFDADTANGVSMDIYSGLATHAAILLVRWMTINHLIYELSGHSVACFLTCNNVATAKQLRKMRENGREACHHRLHYFRLYLRCAVRVSVHGWIDSCYFYVFDGAGWGAKKRHALKQMEFTAFKLLKIQMQGIRWECG